jgi:hypothetical protein
MTEALNGENGFIKQVKSSTRMMDISQENQSALVRNSEQKLNLNTK